MSEIYAAYFRHNIIPISGYSNMLQMFEVCAAPLYYELSSLTGSITPSYQNMPSVNYLSGRSEYQVIINNENMLLQ